MGGICKTGNVTHDTTVTAAEGVRQIAIGIGAITQAAATAAEVTYWRARKASALTNGLAAEAANAQLALIGLGTNGS